ncbi:hypothetical protein N444_22190, partial [Escherichia coli O6:H16:CFA/II str. B2C]
MNILVVYNISLMNWRCQILLFMPGMPEGMEKVRGRVVIAYLLRVQCGGNDSNLLIVFYVQIMPDDFVMQL